jgi:hypothetical protein
VALAYGARGSGWAWGSLGCFAVFHGFSTSLGVDTIGPVHFYELAVPILVLSGLGLRRFVELARRVRDETHLDWVGALPTALVVALLAVTASGYWWVRALNVRRIAENVNIPKQTAAAQRIENAIVFSPRHFAPNCRSTPTRHFVGFRPENDPDLRNDIVWINDLGALHNEKALADYPGRNAFVLAWKEPCHVVFHPVRRR